jgi:hypothetical protein
LDPDGDGIVDVNDLIYVGKHWGWSGTPGAISADVDCNGAVDVNDLIAVGKKLNGAAGTILNPPTVASSPTPMTSDTTTPAGVPTSANSLVATATPSGTPTAAYGGTAHLLVQSGSRTLRPGDRVVVDVIATSDVPVASVEFGLTWDPRIVRVDRVLPGAWLNDYASASGGNLVSVGHWAPDDASGVVTTGGYALVGASGPGPSGSGTVATIELTALGAGLTEIDLTGALLGTQLDHTTAPIDNLTTLGGGVQVAADDTATPTDTPTPSETATPIPTFTTAPTFTIAPPPPTNTPINANATVVVSPSATTVAAGTTNLTLDVVATSDSDVLGFGFGLTFDPSVVQITSVTESNSTTTGWLTSYANANGGFLFQGAPWTVDNTNGTVTNGAVAIVGTSGAGPVGTGTIAEISLTALTSGSTSITLTGVDVSTYVNGQAVPIPNLTIANGQVTIQGSNTVTNTPTPSMTPTASMTASGSTSPTATFSTTGTPTPSATATTTPVLSPSATGTATPTTSGTPGNTATPTLTPTFTMTYTVTPTFVPTGTATVVGSITVDTLTVSNGSTFTVNVNVSTASQVGGIQFGATFNPQVVKANSVGVGTMLSTWGSANGVAYSVNVPFQIDNAAGTISVGGISGLGRPTGSTFGPTGQGVIATISFTALATGTSPVALSNLTLSTLDPTTGQPLSGETVTLQNGQITVNIAMTQTAVPSVTSTLAPPSNTPVPSSTSSAIPTATYTYTPTPSATPTRSPTQTASITPTSTSTIQLTNTPFASTTVAPTFTLPAGPSPTGAPYTGTASLAVSPTVTTMAPGASATVVVVVSVGQVSRGLSFGLTFDASVIAIDSVDEGTFYSDWATANGDSTLVLPAWTVDNSAGTVSDGGVSMTGGTTSQGPSSGSGTAATISFHTLANASGTSPLNFTASTCVSATDDQGVPHCVSNATITNGSITVGAANGTTTVIPSITTTPGPGTPSVTPTFTPTVTVTGTRSPVSATTSPGTGTPSPGTGTPGAGTGTPGASGGTPGATVAVVRSASGALVTVTPVPGSRGPGGQSGAGSSTKGGPGGTGGAPRGGSAVLGQSLVAAGGDAGGAGGSSDANGDTTGGPGDAGSGDNGAGGGGNGSNGGRVAQIDLSQVIDDKGLIKQEVHATDPSGTVGVIIPANTHALTHDRRPLTAIQVQPLTNHPVVPDDVYLIGSAIELGPTGATFEPPITVTLTYDPKRVPTGLTPDDLQQSFFDVNGGRWVSMDSGVDATNHTVSARTSHFTTFGILSRPPPSVNWLLLALILALEAAVGYAAYRYLLWRRRQNAEEEETPLDDLGWDVTDQPTETALVVAGFLRAGSTHANGTVNGEYHPLDEEDAEGRSSEDTSSPEEDTDDTIRSSEREVRE